MSSWAQRTPLTTQTLRQDSLTHPHNTPKSPLRGPYRSDYKSDYSSRPVTVRALIPPPALPIVPPN